MCSRAKTATGVCRGCVLGWLCALCRFRLSDHDTSRCRNIMGAPQMRLKTAGWHQIGRQRSAEGAEGPKWPRWARSEAWTDSRGWFVRDVGNGDTHAHRADASGTHFTSLKPRAALQAPFWGSGEVMQSQRALGALSRPQLPKHAFRMVPERLSHDPPSTRAARHDRLFEH